MAQSPSVVQSKWFPSPGAVALWVALSFIFGLSEVGWNASRLPLWFFGYAALMGLIGPVGMALMGRARSETVFWKGALLNGLGFGLAAGGVMLAGNLLKGTANLPVFALAMLAYGVVAAGLDRLGGKG